MFVILSTRLEGTGEDYLCHCEEPIGDVAISWYDVRTGRQYQEIATACGLAMTGNRTLVDQIKYAVSQDLTVDLVR